MLLLTIYIQFRKCLGRLASKTRLRQAFQKQNSDVRFLFLHASAWSYTFYQYWISTTVRGSSCLRRHDVIFWSRLGSSDTCAYDVQTTTLRIQSLLLFVTKTDIRCDEIVVQSLFNPSVEERGYHHALLAATT